MILAQTIKRYVRPEVKYDQLLEHVSKPFLKKFSFHTVGTNETVCISLCKIEYWHSRQFSITKT